MDNLGNEMDRTKTETANTKLFTIFSYFTSTLCNKVAT